MTLHIVDGKKEDCPVAATGMIIGGLLALILLLGLLLVCAYKFCIVISDRKAVAKFEKELANTKFAMNEMPSDIYKSPVTRFENPMYKKGEN